MALAIRVANTLQALACLSHLIRANVDHPGRVRDYANRAEEKLQTLGKLMSPMLWPPTEGKSHALASR